MSILICALDSRLHNHTLTWNMIKWSWILALSLRDLSCAEELYPSITYYYHPWEVELSTVGFSSEQDNSVTCFAQKTEQLDDKKKRKSFSKGSLLCQQKVNVFLVPSRKFTKERALFWPLQNSLAELTWGSWASLCWSTNTTMSIYLLSELSRAPLFGGHFCRTSHIFSFA